MARPHPPPRAAAAARRRRRRRRRPRTAAPTRRLDEATTARWSNRNAAPGATWWRQSAIVAVVAVTAALIWWTSDARATISRPAARPVPRADSPPKTVPATLRELWTAPSPKTTEPVVVGGSVVTGDGRQRRRPRPGDGSRAVELRPRPRPVRRHLGVPVRRRGLPRRPRLRSGQHHRRQDRQARPHPHRLRRPRGDGCPSDGTTVLSAGDSRLELWRSDMVRMISYGALDARIKPGVPASAAVPAGVGRRQLVGGVGARVLSRSSRTCGSPCCGRPRRRTSRG